MSRRLLLVISVVMGLAASAYAVPLIPDTDVDLPGTTEVLRPELQGVAIEDRLTPFSISLIGGREITGQIQERVVRETVSGTIDFYWRVFNDASSDDKLCYFRLGEFFTTSYDADWRIDGQGDVGPDFAYLFSSDPGYLNFGFENGLAPGQSSKYLFLHTTATSYEEVGVMDVATAGTADISELFATFAPLYPDVPPTVPDGGSTLVLMGLVLSSLGLVHRKLSLR
jgi:hypothetical protein